MTRYYISINKEEDFGHIYKGCKRPSNNKVEVTDELSPWPFTFVANRSDLAEINEIEYDFFEEVNRAGLSVPARLIEGLRQLR